MKEKHTQALHRALRESAGKLSLRGGRLGNEAAALPDLIKTGLEANSFRSEQEGCSSPPLSFFLQSKRDLENPSMGGCPLGDSRIGYCSDRHFRKMLGAVAAAGPGRDQC